MRRSDPTSAAPGGAAHARAAGPAASDFLQGALLALAAASLVLAPAALEAQDPPSCPFERCGLRVQGSAVYRGAGDDVVARIGSVYPDLRFLVAAGDSIALLAREAHANAERAVIAGGVGAVAGAPAAILVYSTRDGVERHSEEGWTALGFMLAGYVAMFMASRWDDRVEAPLSGAVWRYNRAVAAGRVTGPPPELPPLDPDHFGRTGFGWGLVAGALAGSVLTRRARATEDVWLEAFAVPWAGAAAGWVVGRMVPRHDG